MVFDRYGKKRDFQEIFGKELDKRKERQESNDHKWITIKEVIIDGAKKVFGKRDMPKNHGLRRKIK